MSGTAADSMVRRDSGILVDPALAREPDRAKPGREPIAYDPDGRRRLVLTKQDQKGIDRLIKELLARGLGLLVCCLNRPDDTEPCGQPLLVEHRGMPDAGYGCRCTRVHFL